jgi:LmbE family N-acetylglucosaminyl deacetylase
VRDPVVIISPHFDDAVLGAGALLAARPGSTVVTVFAGPPPDAHATTPWDRASGFACAAEAYATRIAEDDRALRVLGASPVRLPFVDAQYDDPPFVEVVRAALRAALEEVHARYVFMPFGLFHSDHELTFEAAATLAAADNSRQWFAYEEPTYRAAGNALLRRLASLPCHRLVANLESCSEERDQLPKLRALGCYGSQLLALGQVNPDAMNLACEPERYWRLCPAATS